MLISYSLSPSKGLRYEVRRPVTDDHNMSGLGIQNIQCKKQKGKTWPEVVEI